MDVCCHSGANWSAHVGKEAVHAPAHTGRSGNPRLACRHTTYAPWLSGSKWALPKGLCIGQQWHNDCAAPRDPVPRKCWGLHLRVSWTKDLRFIFILWSSELQGVWVVVFCFLFFGFFFPGKGRDCLSFYCIHLGKLISVFYQIRGDMEVNQEMPLGILAEQFGFQYNNRQFNMKPKQMLNLESCIKWNCHHPVSFCSQHLGSWWSQ